MLFFQVKKPHADCKCWAFILELRVDATKQKDVVVFFYFGLDVSCLLDARASESDVMFTSTAAKGFQGERFCVRS
jgi:hypothetical protein